MSVFDITLPALASVSSPIAAHLVSYFGIKNCIYAEFETDTPVPFLKGLTFVQIQSY